jgi:hypothetical protein
MEPSLRNLFTEALIRERMAILNFPPAHELCPAAAGLADSGIGRCRTEFRQRAEVALDCACPRAAWGLLPS